MPSAMEPAVTVHKVDKRLGRMELLAWMNDFLQTDYDKIQSLSDGIAYCQLVDAVFPGKVPLHKLNFNVQRHEDAEKNLRVLQAALNKLGIAKQVDVPALSRGKFGENNDFLQFCFTLVQRNLPHGQEAYQALERRLAAQQQQLSRHSVWGTDGGNRSGGARLNPNLLPNEVGILGRRDSGGSHSAGGLHASPPPAPAQYTPTLYAAVAAPPAQYGQYRPQPAWDNHAGMHGGREGAGGRGGRDAQPFTHSQSTAEASDSHVEYQRLRAQRYAQGRAAGPLAGPHEIASASGTTSIRGSRGGPATSKAVAPSGGAGQPAASTPPQPTSRAHDDSRAGAAVAGRDMPSPAPSQRQLARGGDVGTPVRDPGPSGSVDSGGGAKDPPMSESARKKKAELETLVRYLEEQLMERLRGLEELQLEIAAVDRERRFYFNKLRRVEKVCERALVVSPNVAGIVHETLAIVADQSLCIDPASLAGNTKP
eukprot:jgi/Mesvir1/3537/Mv12008-RA.1